VAKKHNLGQFLIFGGLVYQPPFTDEGQISCAVADSWYTLTCEISSRSVYSGALCWRKTQIFAVFGLEHLVVLPIGSSRRKLNTGIELSNAKFRFRHRNETAWPRFGRTMTMLTAGWWRYRLTSGPTNSTMSAALIARHSSSFRRPPSFDAGPFTTDYLRRSAPRRPPARARLADYDTFTSGGSIGLRRAEWVKSSTPSRVRGHQSRHCRGGRARAGDMDFDGRWWW